MKNDLHVILCAESATEVQALLPLARHCATGLRKGLMLLTCGTGDSSWIEHLDIPYAALKSDWRSAIERLPDLFGGILAIVACNPQAERSRLVHPATLLKAFSTSRIAYMAVPQGCPMPGKGWPHRVALTLTDRRESKEKLIWASHFGRLMGSTTLAVHHHYRDEAMLTRFRNNIRYLEKTFGMLGIPWEDRPLDGTHQFSNPDPVAYGTVESDLFIAQTTDPRERRLITLLTGTPERRLLLTATPRPILFLNQRDDLYILCD